MNMSVFENARTCMLYEVCQFLQMHQLVCIFVMSFKKLQHNFTFKKNQRMGKKQQWQESARNAARGVPVSTGPRKSLLSSASYACWKE
jgi:hypothetical protein